MLASCAYYLSCIYPQAENDQKLYSFSDPGTVTVRPFCCVPNVEKKLRDLILCIIQINFRPLNGTRYRADESDCILLYGERVLNK